jgi:hypothetical protein
MGNLKGMAVCILFGFIVGLMTCKNCSKPIQTTNPPEQTKSDTIQKPIPSDTGSIREPVLVLEGGKIPTEPLKPVVFVKHDTLVLSDGATLAELRDLQRAYNTLVSEYEILYNDYATPRKYTDTTRFALGRSIANFEVEKNRAINFQQIQDSLHYTYIKERVTVAAPKRMIGYLEIGGFYQLADPLGYLGTGLNLKFKNDAIIGTSIYINGLGKTIVGGKYLVPIRLGKKR